MRLAVDLGAASVDHCTHLTDADVDALAGGATVATLLPGAEFSTRSPYPHALRLLSAGFDCLTQIEEAEAVRRARMEGERRAREGDTSC